MSEQFQEFNFDTLKISWPSPIVTRAEISRFTGGLVSPGTLANEDSKGTGPERRFQAFNKTVYPVDSVVDWLKKKAKHARRPANPSRRKRRSA